MGLQTIQHGQANWDTPINDMFKELYARAKNTDSMITEDGFSRNIVLSDGLSKPADDASLGVDHFKIGDLNIAYGWGKISVNLKQYQSGHIQLPYPAASYRCVVGGIYTWDGDIRFDSVDNGKIALTPNAEVNGSYNVHFIVIWSEN